MFNIFKTKTEEAPEEKTAFCPYCSVNLEKIPTRKTKCKSCGKEFLVRTHYLTKQKVILTQNAADLYDIEKDKYYVDKSFLNSLTFLSGLEEDKMNKLVEKTRQDLSLKFGKQASLGDTLWGIANKLIQEEIKSNNTSTLKGLYMQMGMYLHNTGRDSGAVVANSFKLDLMEYKNNSVVTGVEVISANDSCDFCKANNGKIFKIADAIEQSILPCNSCTFKLNKEAKSGWCRCCYAPVVD